MVTLTPLACFLIGVLVATTGICLVLLFTRLAVTDHRKRALSSQKHSELSSSLRDDPDLLLDHRLQQIEHRLTALEAQIRPPFRTQVDLKNSTPTDQRIQTP